MPPWPKPKLGDLVSVRVKAHHGKATMTGVCLGRNFSWGNMSDTFVIQVNDKRMHACREDITVISQA